jgi:glycosyltransferase involved in cell wall biosynthesis
MNIAWLKAEYLFPLDSGPKTRTYNLLKRVSKSHTVTYVGFTPVTAETARSLMAECSADQYLLYRPIPPTAGLGFYARVAANLLSSRPYFVKRNYSSALQAKTAQMVSAGGCDILVCDSLDMSLNVDFELAVPKVLFHPSIETTLWKQRYETAGDSVRRSYFNFETKRMAAFEAEICNRFDLIVVASEPDRDELAGRFGVRKPIEVIPTGVDCDYFRPVERPAPVAKRLMFSGSLDLLSNVDQLLWFAAEIYPLIKRRHPDVTLEIVGRSPASEIRALERADHSITVTGWVKDIRTHLQQADVYIVPLRVPGGVRVKLYEAMASRCPVVSTLYGVDGLLLSGGRDVLLAESAREFADAACMLLENPERKEAVAEQGYRTVNEKCDWSVSAARFAEVLERTVAGQ